MRLFSLPLIAWALTFGNPLYAAQAQWQAVQRVVDGDTLLMASGDRVRLIGVDTPEVHPSRKKNRQMAQGPIAGKRAEEIGKRASEFVRALVEGKNVRLEMDPVNARRNHRDRYGRILAYVYFDPDAVDDWPALSPNVVGTEPAKEGFLNALLILEGFSPAYDRFSFSRKNLFQIWAANAKKENRGGWAQVAIFQTNEN